jgi:nucleoside-triphosphatase THEP1
VGDSADLIIVDEVERIDKTHPEVIDDLMAIVNNEQARIIFISTLNWKSQKTRFYDWLKR